MKTPTRDAHDRDMTRLPIDWKGGSKEALDSLTPLAYQELYRLANHYLRDAASTLQPTSLMHEAYLRLVAQSLPDWESRSHFYAVAAHLMRQISTDRQGVTVMVPPSRRSRLPARSFSLRIASQTHPNFTVACRA